MSEEQKEEVKTRVHLLGVEERSLLMIEERINKLRPVELRCFFSLKDFLKVSMETPPDIIAVSMNFKHPNIVQFPTLFAQTIHKPVIVFLEKDDNRSRTLMTGCESDFKITGTVTAHNLWMKICHCLESQAEKEARDARERAFGEGNEANSAILLKGEKLSEQQEDMMSSLGYLLKDLEQGGEGHSGGSFLHEGQESLELPTVMQEGHTGKKPNVPEQDIEPGIKDKAIQQSDINKSSKARPTVSPSDSQTGLAKEGEVTTSGAKTEQSSLSKPHQAGGGKNKKRPSLAEQMQSAADQRSQREGSSSGKGQPSAGAVQGGDNKANKKANAPIDTSGGGRGKDKAAPIQVGARLDEKVKKILLQSSQDSIPEQITLVFQPEEEKTQGLPIVQVKMGHQQGFLVIRSKPPGPISQDWFSQFRTSLLTKLKDAGFEAFITPYMAELQAQMVSQMEQLDEFADQEHREDMEFKFASHKYAEPELPKAIDSGMLEVNPKMIRPNKTVYFDVFIYLPRNQRTVRYLKKGGAMSQEQASRLESNPDAKRLYVNPEDEQQLRRFLLEVSIEDRLAETETKVTEPSKPTEPVPVAKKPSDEGDGEAA